MSSDIVLENDEIHLPAYGIQTLDQKLHISIAISLKRIADSLERPKQSKYESWFEGTPISELDEDQRKAFDEFLGRRDPKEHASRDDLK